MGVSRDYRSVDYVVAVDVSDFGQVYGETGYDLRVDTKTGLVYDADRTEEFYEWITRIEGLRGVTDER